MKTPFHLAFPVLNIQETKDFYGNVLGCEIGREDKKWVDFNFFGHQLSAHVKPDELNNTKKNEVDGKSVPVRHFGVILPWEDWNILSEKLKSIGTDFVIDPYIRFEGEVGEQGTMFFLDPSGNALEFKTFKDPSQIFAS
jgi:extradiol dioxygenase family protein